LRGGAELTISFTVISISSIAELNTFSALIHKSFITSRASRVRILIKEARIAMIKLTNLAEVIFILIWAHSFMTLSNTGWSENLEGSKRSVGEIRVSFRAVKSTISKKRIVNRFRGAL
jgi:hypothetical protein